jgi:PIN domain nuclease of toxin-antitoxin system
VKILLDTHAFLWLVSDHSRLSDKAKAVFLDNSNDLYLSAVSGFEIAVKHGLGKLKLSESPMDFVSRRIENNNLIELPITMEHATNLQNLPLIHRDPFDRLLISQSMVESIPLLSADKQISAYSIECIW